MCKTATLCQQQLKSICNKKASQKAKAVFKYIFYSTFAHFLVHKTNTKGSTVTATYDNCLATECSIKMISNSMAQKIQQRGLLTAIIC